MVRRFRAVLAALMAGTLAFAGVPGAAQEAAPAAPPAAPSPVASAPVANPVETTPRYSRNRTRRPAAAAAAGAASALPPAAPVVLTASPGRPGARLAPGMPIPQPELEAFVDGVVRQAMGSDHIAGVTVSVVQGGQTVLKKGYGYAQLSPVRAMNPDRTEVRLGSISKTFTWILLMKQVERGRMGLNNPVNQYLPEKLQVKDQGFSKAITMRDLMNHTAGFEDRALGHLYERNPADIRPLETYLRRERPDRVREAGALPVYSDYGAALAGNIVSAVANQPFAQLAERDLFLPAGLNRTTFREPYPTHADLPGPMPASLARDLSQGFRWTGGVLEPRPFEYAAQIGPAQSASSTAADMARYMNLLLAGGTLDGVTVYSPATAGAFRAISARATPGVAGWAHGFQEYPLAGAFTGYGHSGSTLSFRTNLVTVPDLGLGVFVAANTETGGNLVEKLPQLIVERFYGGPRLLPAGAANFDARPYAGVYLTEHRAYSGLEKFVALFSGRAVVTATRDGRLAIQTGEGARTWIPAAAKGRFQAVDGPETSAFELSGGKAVRWFAPWGGDSFRRAGILSQLETVTVLAILAVIAAIACLVGLSMRDRRDFRQTSIQSRSSAIQTAASVLWLLAAWTFLLWLGNTDDAAKVVYDWPGPWLLIGSACALVAAILSLVSAALLPAIWRGGRRLDSWTVFRKVRFTATALIFLGLSIVLAANGALEPWSG